MSKSGLKSTQLTADAAKILNYIRQSASTNYKDMVPKAISGDNENLKIIGNVIMSDAIIRNEFLFSAFSEGMPS